MRDAKDNITGAENKSQLLKQWELLYYSLPLDILLVFYLDSEARLADFTTFLNLSLIVALTYSSIYSTRNFWADLLDQKGKIQNFFQGQQKQFRNVTFLLIFAIIVVAVLGFLYNSDFGKTRVLQIIIPIAVAISTLNSLRKAKRDFENKNLKMRLSIANLHLYTSRWISFSAAILAPFSNTSINNFYLCFALSFILLLSFKPENLADRH